MASKMALAKLMEMESARNEVILKVKTSWYTLYKTHAEIASTEKNLILLRSLERMALVRFKAAGNPVSGSSGAMAATVEPDQKAGSSGMQGGSMGSSASGSGASGGSMPGSPDSPMGGNSQGGLVGLLRVQMEIGELANSLVSLQDQLVTQTTRFNLLLNRKPESAVFVADSLPEAILPGTLAQLSDSITNNPMVRMLEADREANEAKIVMATKMGYPMIGIGLNYSLIQKVPDGKSMMNGKDMVMPMLTATLPVYRKKYQSQRREAGYLRDAAGESARNVRNDLEVSYQEALQQYQEAGRRLKLYENQVSLAEKSISLLTRSFSVAGTDLEEILRMQLQALGYEIKQIEARVDQNTAVATMLSIVSYH
jgi:outer membrane protein TolC